MENRQKTKYKQNARQTWNSLQTNAIDLKHITNKMQDRLEIDHKQNAK